MRLIGRLRVVILLWGKVILLFSPTNNYSNLKVREFVDDNRGGNFRFNVLVWMERFKKRAVGLCLVHFKVEEEFYVNSLLTGINGIQYRENEKGERRKRKEENTKWFKNKNYNSYNNRLLQF